MNEILTNIPKSSITVSPKESESILNDFQRNALDTLEAREALARSNMLTVKVKLSKGLKLKGISKVTKAITVNVDIYSTADELASEIASKLLVIQGKQSLERIRTVIKLQMIRTFKKCVINFSCLLEYKMFS